MLYLVVLFSYFKCLCCLIFFGICKLSNCIFEQFTHSDRALICECQANADLPLIWGLLIISNPPPQKKKQSCSVNSAEASLKLPAGLQTLGLLKIMRSGTASLQHLLRLPTQVKGYK